MGKYSFDGVEFTYRNADWILKGKCFLLWLNGINGGVTKRTTTKAQPFTASELCVQDEAKFVLRRIDSLRKSSSRNNAAGAPSITIITVDWTESGSTTVKKARELKLFINYGCIEGIVTFGKHLTNWNHSAFLHRLLTKFYFIYFGQFW